MTSERLQRRIDGFLDEAEHALAAQEWKKVMGAARAVLAIDVENADARAFLSMAEANGATASVPDPGPSPTSATPTMQPTSFGGGRYEVQRFLGEGGKKRVFLAHDKRLDRDVAFALIKTDGLDDVGRERILREAQAMGRLGAHPHIVTIHDIGEENGSPYVVNELLAGGDVKGELEKAGGALPLARTLEIAKAVARGLAFAHERGIVHRDLKPGNVWLTSEGVAKIGDFGLAVSLDRSRLTQHGMMVGTVAYMPPEQAFGGEVAPQADLYSLGAMLYELVTGRPPFQADDPTAIISQHINTPPVAPSWHSEHCPPELETLILKLLAKVPADRPSSASEVLTALEAVDPNARSASHSDSSANPLDRLARGVFVGRERELERLRAAFDDAFAGRGSVVMLVGEPGIGKTRTVQELSTYARMRGAKVLWGRAHEASGAPAYWPWIQAARDYRAQTPDDVRRKQYEPYAVDLQRIFPGLRDLFPGLREPPPVDSEEGQFQLFDALTSFFRAASEETPLVIVLDDLHWADRSTLRMLTHLAREVGVSRLLVTGTYRDTDLDRQHPLSQALAELNREDLFTRINLRGLTEAESAAYIRDTAPAEPTAELVRRVHAETEGNPFFLSEVVRLMAEEGAFSAKGASEIRVPEGVREALGRRLDRLSPEANELLSVAAVVGRECSHALLAALTDFDDDILLALIEEALRARVLEETGAPGEYRFTHALMQDALYSELSTARRVRTHGRVAETLEVLHASEREREAAQLARHFGEASVMNRSLAEKAVQYAELAAQQADAVAAWDDAAKWYRQAIDGLQAAPQLAAREGDLWIALTTTLRMTAGRRAESWVAFDRAIDAFRRHGPPGALATALARSFSRGGPTTLLEIVPYREVLSEAISGLGDAPSWEACFLLSTLASIDYSAVGDTYASRAREMAFALGLEGAGWPWRLESREVARLLDLGEYEKAGQRGEELHRAVLPYFPRQMPMSRMLASTALYEAGLVDEAKRSYGRHAALAEERKMHSLAQGSRVSLARIQLARNERSSFERLLGEIPQNYWIALAAANDALVRGDIALATRRLPPRDHADRPLNDQSLPALGIRVLVARGEIGAAQAAFNDWREFISPARTIGQADLLRAFSNCADGLLALGDPELHRQAYQLFCSHSRRRLSAFGESEAADVVRGALALQLGESEAAERHYLDGLEWARRPDVRFGLVEGRCLQGLAEIAEARGEHARALEHLDAAATRFAEYGAKLYLDQVLAKKQLLKA